MWLAPEFHHAPRWLVAEHQALSSDKPARINFFARVCGRFHCRQSKQRNFLFIQLSLKPFSYSPMPFQPRFQLVHTQIIYPCCAFVFHHTLISQLHVGSFYHCFDCYRQFRFRSPTDRCVDFGTTWLLSRILFATLLRGGINWPLCVVNQHRVSMS